MTTNEPRNETKIPIKIHYEGTLDTTRPGVTCMGHLLPIGAIQALNLFDQNLGGFRSPIATLNGFDRILSMTEELVDWVNYNINTLGLITAYVDWDDLRPGTARDIGWAIKGFAELANHLEVFRSNLVYEQKKRTEMGEV